MPVRRAFFWVVPIHFFVLPLSVVFLRKLPDASEFLSRSKMAARFSMVISWLIDVVGIHVDSSAVAH